MTTTINGHVLTVLDCAEAEALWAKAEQFRAADDYDGLERWLYAGAPLDKDLERWLYAGAPLDEEVAQ
jgi:hypothetical protein